VNDFHFAVFAPCSLSPVFCAFFLGLIIWGSFLSASFDVPFDVNGNLVRYVLHQIKRTRSCAMDILRENEGMI